MCLYQKKFSLPSQKVNRRKTFLQNDNDEKLFKKEYEKILPAVYPIINKNSYISPCGRLVNGLKLNIFQFSKKLSFREFFKTYVKYLFFLFKIRKVSKVKSILYITNSNSHNFFHWFLDVFQNLSLLIKIRNKF